MKVLISLPGVSILNNVILVSQVRIHWKIGLISFLRQTHDCFFQLERILRCDFMNKFSFNIDIKFIYRKNKSQKIRKVEKEINATILFLTNLFESHYIVFRSIRFTKNQVSQYYNRSLFRNDICLRNCYRSNVI